jgi:hypothetical protein
VVEVWAQEWEEWAVWALVWPVVWQVLALRALATWEHSVVLVLVAQAFQMVLCTVAASDKVHSIMALSARPAATAEVSAVQPPIEADLIEDKKKIEPNK